MGVKVSVGVFVNVAEAVGEDVSVGVNVNLGVLVGLRVFVGLAVFVGREVFVGFGVLLGLGAASTAAGACPRKDTRIKKIIVNRLDLNKNVFMEFSFMCSLLKVNMQGQNFHILLYDTGNQPGGIVTARIKPYDSVPFLI